MYLVALYIFLYGAYDIAIAGELKDIGQAHEDNLLRRLGADVNPRTLRFLMSQKGRLLAALLTLWKALAIGAVALAVGGTLWGDSDHPSESRNPWPLQPGTPTPESLQSASPHADDGSQEGGVLSACSRGPPAHPRI